MSDPRVEGVVLELPADAVAAIARRAAELVVEQLQQRPADVSPYLTVKEAADRMRCKPQRVYDLLSAARLTRYKDGTRALVSRDEVDAYLLGEPRPVAPTLPPGRKPACLQALGRDGATGYSRVNDR